MSQPHPGPRAHDLGGEFLHPSSFLADCLPEPSVKILTPRRSRVNADGRGQALHEGSSVSRLELLCGLCHFSQQKGAKAGALYRDTRSTCLGLQGGAPPTRAGGVSRLPGVQALTQRPKGRLVPGFATYRPSDTATRNLSFLTGKVRPLTGATLRVTQMLSSRIQTAWGHSGLA